MAIARFIRGSQPFWPDASSKKWFSRTADVNGTTPAHPFAAIGEQTTKLAAAATPVKFQPYYGSSDQGLVADATVPPDSTRGWAMRVSFFWYVPTTLPTSQERIFGAGAGGAVVHNVELHYETDGKVSLYQSLVASPYTMTLVATSAASLPTGAFLQFDLFEVYKDAAGADLATRYFVLRYWSALATAPAKTTLLTVNTLLPTATYNHLWLSNDSPTGADVASFYGGVAPAGYEPYVCQFYAAWEDAADVYGVIRTDRLDPTAVGVRNDYAGNAANIDESGTAIPDDATTVDSLAAVNGTKKQTYKTWAAATKVASIDRVIGIAVAIRHMSSTSPFNTLTVNWSALISDGTNDRYGDGQVTPGANVWSSPSMCFFSKNPANTAWVPGDIAGLEVGVLSSTDVNGTFNRTLSTVTTMVFYEKSGEGGGALPAAPSTRRVFVC